MKTPPDPVDPLLQSLAEEAADLPLKAANEARKARALRAKHRRQIAIAVTVLFCGVSAWQMLPTMDTGRELVVNRQSPDALASARRQTSSSSQLGEYLIARTEEQARNEPLPLPDGLTEEQANVVKSARGLPLLLVRDSVGKVARIHVIER